MAYQQMQSHSLGHKPAEMRGLDQFSEAGEIKSDDVLCRNINWSLFVDIGSLSQDDLEILTDIHGAPEDDRRAMMEDSGHAIAETFVRCIMRISDEDALQYLLALVDTILEENADFVNFFRHCVDVYEALIGIIRRCYGPFTVSTASKVAARLLVTESDFVPDMGRFIEWLLKRIENPVGTKKMRDRDLLHSLNALKIILRNENAQSFFVERGGGSTLADLMSMYKDRNGQVIYVTGFCIWLLSYSDSNCRMFRKKKLVKLVVDALRAGIWEKVSRITLAILINLLDKEDFNAVMIENDIIKTLVTLESRPWLDTDVDEMITSLYERLQKDVKILSSFERYAKEISSKRLAWGPVHTENFWRENHEKFHEDNFKLVRYLAALVDSRDARTVAVACYDLGEFCRFSPQGKRVINKLGVKEKLMEKMSDPNEQVAKQSLLAVQKLMVKNWEFLQRPTGSK
eukprot:193367_1